MPVVECNARCRASASREKFPGSFSSSFGPIIRPLEPGVTVQVDEVVSPSGIVPPGKWYVPLSKSLVALVPATTPKVSF